MVTLSGFKNLTDVMRCCVPFDIEVRRDNDLFYAFIDNPRFQFLDSDFIGAYAFDGIYHAVEDMVAKMPRIGRFDDHHVGRFLDDADNRFVPSLIPAYNAGVAIGNIETDAAKPYLFLDVCEAS